MANFDRVRETVETAQAITWDTCHKIYVLMDAQQIELMRKYDYEPILTANDLSNGAMLDKLEEWYEDSCGLRFISSVKTNEVGDTIFTDLISQDWS